ncbi:lactate permease [Natronoarchaeum philippinense]|uniref:Lactate permease n=1 Tax=Natronoarchaeum philippinense TaxID=558529 RepID=A0A285NTD0_NATPI|nr:lactate permease [Natronoarchaeum philippinense]
MALAALSPLAVVAALLVGALWPATRAMPVAWATAAIVGFVAWNMPVEWVLAASISGVLTAIEILWIVFGALALLYTLMRAGAVDRINAGFVAISEDRRVQVVLVGFFLATFLEGVAGFGTPAAVVAPLLLALGFPPLAAVVAALVGHAIATTFGAVGVPVRPGVEEPLGALESLSSAEAIDVTLQAAGAAALYQVAVGVFMPLVAVGMIVHFFGDPEERSLSAILEVVPLCLFAGIAFVVPFALTALFVGPELPSIVGAMVGAAVVVAVLRAGYLHPDEEWTFRTREHWPDHWIGSIEPGSNGTSSSSDATDGLSDDAPAASMSLARAWTPYVLLVVLLIATRDFTPIGVALTELSALAPAWDAILGTDIGGEVRWAYVPGTWLALSALAAIPLFGMDRGQVESAWREAGQKLVSPAVALVFVIAMVGIMTESGAAPNAPSGDSMMIVLADATASVVGDVYPAVATVVGVLGTFITGSITVSNLTFSQLQYDVAVQLGLPTHHILAAQMVGAAIGNVLAIHNVIAALATVGLVGQEGRVVRLNLFPVLYYVVAMGALVSVVTLL